MTAISNEENESFRKSVPEFMMKTPYLSTFPLEITKYENDDIELRLKFRENFTNDGTVYHGGVIATVVDTAGALAAWSNHDFNKGAKASTVSIALQYIAAAKKSDLIVKAFAKKRGKELIFVEIDAYDENSNLVAHALQTYRIA